MPHVTHNSSTEITIGTASAADLREIRRVAGRDTEAMPPGPLLVAKVAGDARAAISLADGSIVADPFHRTAELVEMLRIRAGAAASTAGGAHAMSRRRRRRSFHTARAA